MAPPPPGAASRKRRRWLPVFGVAAVLLVVVLGGEITQGALATERGAPAGVAGVVTVRPLSGWRVAGRTSVDGIPDLRLTRGNGNLDVLAPSSSAAPDGLVDAYLHQILSPAARQLQVSSVQRVSLGGGIAGARGFYIGLFGDRATPIEGEVTAVVVRGAAVLFDGWAPSGEFQYVRGDVHAMIDDARYA
ncbi:MAG: hypothetical protein ABR600_04295 [Actinomycetota bacterium]